MAQGTDAPITRERITAVEQVIRSHIRRTPVLELDGGDLGLRSFPLTLTLKLVFPIARAQVAEVVLVTDGSIQNAQETLWSTVRVVAEPGGAVALAAVLSGR